MSAARLAAALARIAPSRTTAMTDRAAELRGQGRDIISLSVGEPDFATPPHVVEAAKAAEASAELAARLRALLRRASGRSQPTWRHGDLEYDPASKLVRWRGQGDRKSVV